jgi:hypothetical protein
MAFLHAGARQGGHDLHPQVALHASMPLLLSHLDQASGLEAVLRMPRPARARAASFKDEDTSLVGDQHAHRKRCICKVIENR